MNFQGTALPVSPDTFSKIATALKVEEAMIRAFCQVEAPKGPFDKHGRPAMLFEPHKFYHHLSQRAPELLPRAVKEGLAYPNQGTHPYPADSYPRMAAAYAIHPECALMSASWGSSQILGENYEALGYASAQALVEDAMKSADLQMLQMAKLIKAKPGLVAAMKRHDFEFCARSWNGPKFRKFNYHTLLKNAYIKWSKKTPPKPVTIDVGLTKEEIKIIQQRLIDRGYHEVGRADGLWGTRTDTAVTAFQLDNGLPKTGQLDEATKTELFESEAPRPIAEARRKAINIPGSKTLGMAKGIISGGAVLGGGSGISGYLQQANDLKDQAVDIKDQATSLWEMFDPISNFIANHPMMFFSIGCFGAAAIAAAFAVNRIIDHRQGRAA